MSDTDKAKQEVPTEEPAIEPGDFPIELQAMMEDYEAQIAAKARECMLTRMKLRAVEREFAQIKELVAEMQMNSNTPGIERPLAAVPTARPKSRAKAKPRSGK